eukprot:TRINITY_DN18124_c0_g1_i1.p1 TRINITY_DN18124_c0_g1~~TRINITY_DN18124_c0_g1_i1.p1  ORF type:complete len:136 (+),score=20.98 TRINITY_DN18124_c0_g1_i1:112-519(+)
MLRSLVGSEMCIRDSPNSEPSPLSPYTPISTTETLPGPAARDRMTCPTHTGTPRPAAPGTPTPSSPRTLALVMADELRVTKPCTTWTHPRTCLLYTSDAADEEDSVDLGGRRIIKKKKEQGNKRINSTHRKEGSN